MTQSSDAEVVLNDANSFPGYSTYERKKHCGVMMTYYPASKKWFWNEWEFQPAMPLFVIILMVTAYLFLLFCILPRFKWEIFFIGPLELFFLVMFIWSYIQIIKVGPGYLPFYHQAMLISHLPEAPQDFMITGYVCPPDGVITREEQYLWAHELPKPTRCILAHSASRYVIRPDHLCGWTTVWIGKRNYKMFILFNLYGIPYLWTFSAYCVRFFMKIFESDELGLMVFTSIYGILALSFSLLVFAFSISSICNAAENVTSWETWNNSPASYDTGSCKENMKDVCGNPSSKLEYFCPRSPFSNITNQELIGMYDP